MFWIVRDKNIEATEFYLDILEASIISAGHKVRQVDGVTQAMSGSKEDIYLTITPIDALKLYINGRNRIVFWFQGIVSEESFMKHKSLLRKKILEYLEKFILKKAEFIFFVSDEMKLYFEQKFQLKLDCKCYIMPCFNSKINKEAFMAQGKYDNNVFCYAGSLSVWQGFPEILKCYKEIEKIDLPGTKLLILTKEKPEAQRLVELAGIKNYAIDYVPLEQLPIVLAQAKYGFIIRQNVVVNRVATPTKISTYMANGLIPIYSECLSDFNKIADKVKYVIRYNEETFYEQLKKFGFCTIEPFEIYKEYLKIFRTYYNANYHVKKISDRIKSVVV